MGPTYHNPSLNNITPQILLPQELSGEIDLEEQRRFHYLMGKLYYDKAAFEEAEEAFGQALVCGQGPRDIFASLKTLGFLIRIASEKQLDAKAKQYIAHAEKLVDELTSVLGSLNAEYFYNAGIVQNYKGNFPAAKDNFVLCCKKAEEENEPELLAKCLLSLATNCYNTGDAAGALKYLDKLEQLLRIIDKSYLRGSMYLFFGKVFWGQGEFQKALDYLSKANSCLQMKKCWNLYGYLLLWKGKVFRGMGDISKALVFFELGQESVDPTEFVRLKGLLEQEIAEVNDNNVDIYLDRVNRKVKEKQLGTIDFKHRFVLLEILFLLAKNTGAYYNKDQLAKLIWKDEYNPLIHDKLIYTSISRLRKLIEPVNEKGSKRQYIVRGKDGYTFNPLARICFHIDNKANVNQSIANVELTSPV